MISLQRFLSLLNLCLVLIVIGAAQNARASSGVVINEIFYNASDDQSINYEFIELYNPSDDAVDLSGFAFTDGVIFQFPDGALLPPKGFRLVVSDSSLGEWNRRQGIIFGVYSGRLDNTGERIRLRSPDGSIVDELDYDDSLPWPRGADGYGSSLEKVQPYEPSNDPYAWRSSLTPGGTPGMINSTAADSSRPVVMSWSISPPHPRSTDEVRIEVALDGGEEAILAVDLRYEVWSTVSKSSMKTLSMDPVASSDGFVHYKAVLPAQSSQSLVRFNWRIGLADRGNVILPHDAEPRPFESYFVYDNEIPTLLPILWMFPDKATSLSPSQGAIRGVAVKPLESDAVELYDGARIIHSLVDKTGRKIKFLKGEEFRGDRTINISPECPTHPNSGGADTNHKEHLAFPIFRDQGVLAPRCDWYRVIESGVHGQRTATQQVNEKFLEINQLDPDADIYKIAYNEPNSIPGYSIHYSKQTNLEEGPDDLFELFALLKSGSEDELKATIQRYLELDKVIGYSVAGVLIGNWDGFFNNMFLIHLPYPVDLWQCVPWDLDKTFGYTDGFPPHSTTFAEMPLEFPLNGKARLASRQPGPISRPVHQIAEYNEEYLQRVREALWGVFSLEEMDRRIKEIEALLLEDLQLEADYTGVYRTRRKNQIESTYDTIRTFLQLRHDYLRPLLFTPVENWSLYD
ncbi:MAG: CotH kinase family protein [Candidatus Omnitrophica bacterium]|nr:CotH kinase family protein [Candidatus Omnitrophota bacterium]